MRRAGCGALLLSALLLAPGAALAGPVTPRLDGKWVRWLLAWSGPCPNCDARQTLRGKTVLPSPLPSARREVAQTGARPLDQSARPDTLTWPRLRAWLAGRPPGLDPYAVMKSMSVWR